MGERKRVSCWGLFVPQAPKDAAISAVAKSTRAGGRAFIGLVAKAGGDSTRVGAGFASAVCIEGVGIDAVCIEDGSQTLDGFQADFACVFV